MVINFIYLRNRRDIIGIFLGDNILDMFFKFVDLAGNAPDIFCGDSLCSPKFMYLHVIIELRQLKRPILKKLKKIWFQFYQLY